MLGRCECFCPPFFTFSPHAHLETLFEAAVLALIAVVLVDRAVAGAPALVCQVPPHRSLEEALASCGRRRRGGGLAKNLYKVDLNLYKTIKDRNLP